MRHDYPLPEEDLFKWHERIVRLEEKYSAAEKALSIARESISTASVVSVITIIISIVSLVVVFIRR